MSDRWEMLRFYLKHQGSMCYRCFKKEFGLRIKPTDCYFHDVKGPCAKCRKPHHPVIGIAPLKKWKLYLKPPKDYKYVYNPPDYIEDDREKKTFDDED